MNGLWLSNTQFYDFNDNKLHRSLQAVNAAHRDSANAALMGKLLKIFPNPDLILKKAGKKLTDLREVRDDAHVMAAVQSRKAGVLSMEWDVDKGKQDDDINVFVKKMFDNIDVYDTMANILEYFCFGFSINEVLYDYNNITQKIHVRSIAPRIQDNFHFDSNGVLRFKHYDDQEGRLLIQNKFLVARHFPTDANAYGEALLSRCYWYVIFKKQMIRFWLRFAEKFGMAHTIGQSKRGATQEDMDELLKGLEDMVVDGVGIIPEGTVVQFLEANKSGSTDLFERFILFANNEISKAILSHTGSIDSTPGKLGNENSADTVREDIVEQDKRVVEKTFNKLIKTIVDINFENVTQYPAFTLYQKETLDRDRAERDDILIRSQTVKFTKNYYVRNYGFKDDEIEIVEPSLTKSLFSEFAGTKKTGQQLVNKMIDDSAAALSKALDDSVIDSVIEFINSGKDYDAVVNQIHTLLPDFNDEQILAVLEHALVLANATGRLTED